MLLGDILRKFDISAAPFFYISEIVVLFLLLSIKI